MAESGMSWGARETQFFFQLTPEKVLEAVEAAGFVCTGRCSALNSFENRVYDVEIELDPVPRSIPERFRVVKFYRPGRWTREQILEEHEFLLDLEKIEVPVVAPLRFSDGSTLRVAADTGIFYAIFPKVGGRAPDEFTDEQIERIGRLLARIHTAGAAKEAKHRILLGPETYGWAAIQYLKSEGKIPAQFRDRYFAGAEEVCKLSEPFFKGVANQRIHGDCHLGNLLWNNSGPFFLDFDDMVRGPCVQDLWLLVRGRDEECKEVMRKMIAAYEIMRPFDRSTLRLIEPLRALRFLHFTAWIAKRWDDPAFPRAFSYFTEEKYWQGQIEDLREQAELIREPQFWQM